MLTGQNGILNRAAEAKEKTELASIDEQRKLAQSEALMNTTDTNYNGIEIPKGFSPTKIKGEDSIDLGLVITDKNGNEYIWVEVPKTIYTDSTYNTNGIPNSANDWEKIRDCLKAYTSDYSKPSCMDTNIDGTTYSNDYKNMLKSLYTNGGFWIGRYEAGIDEENKVSIKANQIPCINVTRDKAQTLAQKLDYEGYTSSLIYGVQWDLLLKNIEQKNITDKTNLTSNSTTLGNYNTNLWNITNKNAKYSIDYGKNFTSCPYTKKINSNVLLTTGADKNFSLMNIYDLAGNLYEWTLEFYDTNSPCVRRGGSYYSDGSKDPIKDRGFNASNYSANNVGFRIGLWK